MAKLKRLAPSLQPMVQRVRYLDTGTERDRTARAGWRAWYKTARWQKLRDAVVLKADLTCSLCGWQHPEHGILVLLKAHNALHGFKVPRDGTVVADHIVPHRGDERLFWDAANLQCLCKPCHDRHKQRAEATGALG